MQQRRGTAAQWTSANPILAAGEIGFETDTGKFKMGNGSSAWSALSYFADASDFDTSAIQATVDSKVATAIDNLVGGAPAALNTLNELAVAINSDSTFATTVTTALASKATTAALNAHEAKTTDVHGIANTSLLATTANVATAKTEAKAEAISDAADDATAKANAAQAAAIAAAASHATATANQVESNAANDATAKAGAAQAAAASDATTKANAAQAAAIAQVTAHADLSLEVHGIENTANLATKAYADSAVSTHNSDSTDVHGIADTANLVTLAGTQTLTNKTITSPSGLVKGDVGLGNVDNTSDADKPVSTAAQTALDLKAPLASPTFTGTVTTPLSTAGYVKTNASGVLSSSAEIAQADVTSLTADLAAKAPLASPELTGTPTAPTAAEATNTTQIATTAFVKTAVDNVIASAPGALDTLNELATALGNDANFSTTITNSLAAKAPIASPTFTGTVTVAASGIAFTDGTQTKEGVPSRTTITQQSASYNLSTGGLTLRDGLLELSSASAITLTIPANSTTAYPVGTSIDILQTGAGQVTVAGAAGVTVNATPGLKLRSQYSSATLFKRATDTWVVMGDLSA